MKTCGTLKQVRARLAAEGVVLRFDRDNNEYRVNFKKGREATAYYTDDRCDALATGLHMAKPRRE